MVMAVVMAAEGKGCPSPLLVAGAGEPCSQRERNIGTMSGSDGKREKDQNAGIGKRMALSLQGHTGCASGSQEPSESSGVATFALTCPVH